MAKKAVIIGGSSGVGLATVSLLVQENWKVIVVDKEPFPIDCGIDQNSVEYIYSDLLNYDAKLYATLSQKTEVSCLMITAGIGRVCNFEWLHISEIEKTFTINTLSILKILNQFYHRIKSSEDFYCGVMCSIAGRLSSPMFSIYAASKSALCRFIESVNIEIEESGCRNRILDISPGSIKGTKFNGCDKTDIDAVMPITKKIIESLISRETLLIPDYKETYKDVLQRYKDDSHEFGLQSFQYKKDSGRATNCSMARIGYLSGTFDLFHIGHLNLLKRAKSACDYLVVGVHPSGAWKGKETFIPLNERKEILRSIRFVDEVIEAPDEDSDAWDAIRYNYLFVGSDYQGTERFERYEKELGKRGVEIVYFPYTTTTSSTQLRQALKDAMV